jgi:hypothetical protein
LGRYLRLGAANQPAALPVDLIMDKPFVYAIRVEGHLTERWSDWFGGLAICNEPDGVTILRGSLSDQAALLGILNKINALNLTLVSVTRSATNEPEAYQT